jgi:hypothetical protein
LIGAGKKAMVQAETRSASLTSIIRSAAFAAGVKDVRTGRRARFDQFDCFEYERGRQWAVLAPPSMQLRRDGRINPWAIALLNRAFDLEEIL